MDSSALFAVGLLGTAIMLLVVAATIGFFLWRAQREAARHKSLPSTF
jgi:hypothetical protein